MPKPWESPPLPDRADSAFSPLFSAVGEFLSAWEYIEFKLARLYSLFHAAEDDWETIRRYGDGLVYKYRIQQLADAADTFFVKRPSQEMEAGLAVIRQFCDGFAGIRNDIAHGVVFDCAKIPELRSAFNLPTINEQQFLIIPAIHTFRKYAGVGIGKPLYGYNSDLIRSRFLHLTELQGAIDAYLADLSLFSKA